MIVLINLTTHPYKINYRLNSKSFIKQISPNQFVAMEDLNDFDQIKNEKSLIKHGITIWDYEKNTFLNQVASVSLASSARPFAFVPNDSKVNTSVSAIGYSGTTTASAMTFTASAIAASTVYGFVTSANTAMANNTISATTIGNNRYISFSGTAITTTNWYGAVLSGATLPAYVTISGMGAGTLGTGTTFYLSASTLQSNAGFINLQRLV